jgi:hypothetical protein
MVSIGFPMIDVFEQTRAARWSIALGFVALWHFALQLVAELWFGTAPGAVAQLLDLAMHLVVGALLFAHARSLALFLPAVGLLMVVLHLGNAAKIAILGGPIMPDDVAALRSLFLILQGWQLVVASIAVVLAAGLSLAALQPSFSRAWPASVVLGGAVLGLWLAPAAVAATLDRWVGNRLWDQRHNFESRGIVLHLAQEGARHLARRERPPSLQEVARALGDLRPPHAVEAGLNEPAAPPLRNVHVIVLESFWDVSLLTGARLSEDPMDPRFRLLWEAGGYSHALSPVFGGYTANAEFEALCGFPVSDDAVFFETRLRRDAPCLPRHLAESGYVTLASHPNVAAFWNRVNAYRRVGFQTYWSQNDFELDDMNREMLSDASLYRQVLARIRPLLEAGTPLFNYILTFSGHLDYPLGPSRPPVVTAGSAEPLVAPYANNLYYKSRELMEFLAALHDADPDGIVIVFGDHLPPLGYEYAAYVESGLLAPERSGFTDAMFRTLVATPLLILDGQNGPIAVGDLPMYRLPTVILGLLGDRRPSPLTLAATVPEPTVRPLPGTNLILVDGVPHACRAGLDDHPACTRAADWLASLEAVALDVFTGRQHSLRALFGGHPAEPDAL